MLYVVAVEYSQFHSYTDTVVSTQCGSLGTHPLSIYIRGNALLVEVNLYIRQTVANHIHVALQDNRLAVLISRGSSLADNHVAHFIDFRLQTTALTEALQVLNHLLFTLRRAWNFVNLRKMFEDNCRF